MGFPRSKGRFPTYENRQKMATTRRRIAPKQPPRIEDFTCSICLEILKSPHRLPCSHLFCKACLDRIATASQNGNGLSCPYCRKNYQRNQVVYANDIEQKLRSEIIECKYCFEELHLRHMQKHLDQCSDKKFEESLSAMVHRVINSDGSSSNAVDGAVAFSGARIAGNEISPSMRKESINVVKSTFDCPCCNVKRLGRESLLQHVITKHQGSNPHVVCPICATMPWGDPNQKSANFVQHMQLRHRFDYDYFVDMNKDEDTVLKEVLTNSMYDQGRFQ